MLALVLIDHALRQRAQCADAVCPTPQIPAQAPPDAIDDLRSTLPVDDPEPDEA